ncbi:MAG: hypothetical protein MI919_02590, partial [Holophagales bacterium]|nr:hypothetical protein [Holophagales bacterium]
MTSGEPRSTVPAAEAAGRLSVVGTGIVCGLHTSTEARWSIRNADRVFYLINSLVAERWVLRLHPEARSLHDCYAEGKARID